MKILSIALIVSLILATGIAYCEEDSSDRESSSGGNQALTGALMGGLLGGGLGAAIGSASGNAGKGALIGAGVGAVGGTLLGANQAAKERQAQSYSEPQTKATEVVQPAKIKKKVIREYDAEGNVISEKEVKK